MKLSFVFLCLSLATLSLAAIPSAKKNGTLSRSKQVKKDGGASRATGRSSQAAKKKLVEGGKPVPKKRLEKRVGATKGVASAGAGEESLTVTGSGKSSQEGSAALRFFPKVLVELISGYLEGYSVVFTRDWSAVYSWYSVAVDSERHYLITDHDVQASSHGNGEQVNIGSPSLSRYDDFQSSHDGCSLLFTDMTQEQIASESSSEITARWLVQDTSTKSFKRATLEGGETFYESNEFMLSTNGKTLVSTCFNVALKTWATSVYQIKEHEKTASASKKGDINGYAQAISGNGNRILMEYTKKKRLEIHDISGDGSHLVLKISCARIVLIGRSCALNTDGSKAAFIVNCNVLYTVDVNKEKGSISVSQLTPINIPDSVLSSKLIYDAKGRLYALIGGNLWLVDPSKREFISLEEAQVPQGYEIWSWDVSPNVDYIALLFRSADENEKGERQFQMIVKRNDKIVLMRLCGYKY